MAEMAEKEKNSTEGKAWLEQNWPNMRVADVNWTMERGDFPQHARDYIFKNWIKVNDENGGTYCELVYFEEKYKKRMAAERRAALLTRHGVEETKNGETADKYSRGNGMDKRNTTALHVLETQGSKAAIKHMFTDDKTGRELSYAEMRSRYG